MADLNRRSLRSNQQPTPRDDLQGRTIILGVALLNPALQQNSSVHSTSAVHRHLIFLVAKLYMFMLAFPNPALSTPNKFAV
jgi:hypothetical protein